MIQSTYNNFGGGAMTFKCRNSSDIVVIQGKFSISVENGEFLAAEELEIEFDTEFAVRESLVSSCYLVHEYDGQAYCTLLRCWLKDGDRLVIEKIDGFTYKSDITIYLASGFVAKGKSQNIEVLPSEAIKLPTQESIYSATVTRCANRYEDDWGFLSIYFDAFSYNLGGDLTYPMNGFITDIDIEIPLVCTGVYSNYADGSGCVIVTIDSEGLHVSCDTGSGRKYANYSILSFFFVREPAADNEGEDDQDGTDN